MSASVEELLQRHGAQLWRARERESDSGAAAAAGLPTGYAALDRCLPGGGWPRQGLIEILSDQRGIGELNEDDFFASIAKNGAGLLPSVVRQTLWLGCECSRRQDAKQV